MLHGISSDIDRGLNVTKEIRNYAKMHEFKAGTQMIEIVDILKNIKHRYLKVLNNNHISLSFSGLKKAHVKADIEHLNSIFTNVILNAKEALIDDETLGGTIHIHIEKANSNLIVKIKDNGPGIPKALEHDIFEPFFTTKPPSGTGLGLGIVKRLVSLYDGQIAIESITGNGTSVEIIFPNRSSN